MSCTTIKAIWPGEKSEDYFELRNSWGSAPVIWDAMYRRYVDAAGSWLSYPDRLWPLAKRVDIPKPLRAVFMMTLDCAYVARKDYPRAFNDIIEFMRVFPPNGGANHWIAIAAIFEGNPDVPAIGMWCTNVADDPWSGQWNEEKKKREPFDWNEAYDIYAELDK